MRTTSDYTLGIKFPMLLCLHLITHRSGFTTSLELLLTELFSRFSDHPKVQYWWCCLGGRLKSRGSPGQEHHGSSETFKHRGTRRSSSPCRLWGHGAGKAGSHLVNETGKLVVEVLDLLLLVGPHLALLGVHAHAQGLEELGVDADSTNALRAGSAEAESAHGHAIAQAPVAAQAAEGGAVPKAHDGAEAAPAEGDPAAAEAGAAESPAATAAPEGNPLSPAQVTNAAAAEGSDPAAPSHGLAHGGRAAVGPAQAAHGGG